MWNELVKDGEIVTEGSEGLINSAGILAKKGIHVLSFCTNWDSLTNWTKYYYNEKSVEKYLMWGVGNQLLSYNIPTFYFNVHPNMIVLSNFHVIWFSQVRRFVSYKEAMPCNSYFQVKQGSITVGCACCLAVVATEHVAPTMDVIVWHVRC